MFQRSLRASGEQLGRCCMIVACIGIFFYRCRCGRIIDVFRCRRRRILLFVEVDGDRGLVALVGTAGLPCFGGQSLQ